MLLGLISASTAIAQAGQPPTVVTNDASDITASSARLNGDLTSLGTAASANVSFEWGTSSGNYSSQTPAQTANVTGTFSYQLDNLSANTTYYFRAKAVGQGSDNGSEKSFLTKPMLKVTAVGDAINENNVATVSGNITYFGTSENLTLIVDWGDGSSPGSSVQPATAANYTRTHLYLDDGIGGTSSDNYTVRVTVTNGQGNAATATANVTVLNVPPTVNAGPDRVIFSGDNLSLTAFFSDPGTLDTHTAKIEWGDGDVAAGVVKETAGSGNVTGSQVYFVPGHYTATVRVTDDDTGQGSDNLSIEVKAIPVTIDIKPGSWPNSINPDSRGVIPVAIISTEDFDATEVSAETVRFGPDQAKAVQYAIEDVDDDGLDDMILHFRTQDTGLGEQDTEATLTGQTEAGKYFTGKDSIRIVPPEGKGKATGKDNAPGQNKEPGGPAEGKGGGKDTAPGQNKEPGENAEGKAVGKDAAPGQNKEPGERAEGKAKGK
jgi:hypothetical protein